ncbi:hypothetical protein K469DRAFT_746454 [Zopfia rhizophila CBS 207.26]|uniref:Uncharacterized protein n=1 Tax=Zopfia rhizophila CBS 207.26 TaxID=1314779 RepID=A0A6A6EJT0_9PEZI|nr:hypothetical protein K469DRAFT_746454 [Zopfia rhizophila CBS 207.26]
MGTHGSAQAETDTGDPPASIMDKLQDSDQSLAAQQNEIEDLKRQFEQSLNLSSSYRAQLEEARATLQRYRQQLDGYHDAHGNLSTFIMQQGNQKIYEAAFFKAFLVHALDPGTINLKEWLADGSATVNNVEEYLQSVSENVDQVTDKIIWNAHHSLVNFLASHGEHAVPFLDTDHFKESISHDYSPGNSPQIVRRLKESWTRVWNVTGLVQCSASDYPLTNGDPFKAIAAARALFEGVTEDGEFPKGRPYQGRLDRTSAGQKFQALILPNVEMTLPDAESTRLEPDPTLDVRMNFDVGPTLNIQMNMEVGPSLPEAELALDSMSVVFDATPSGEKRVRKRYYKKENWRPRLLNAHMKALANRWPPCPNPSHDLPDDIASVSLREKKPPPPKRQKKQKKDTTSKPVATQARAQETTEQPEHPSGSRTLEIGQTLPEGSYWEPEGEDDKPAWRCDAGHALGRYYMAGDKKTCVGWKGTYAHQYAPGIVYWRPYKSHKPPPERKTATSTRKKRQYCHSQIATKTYRVTLEAGFGEGDALKRAVEAPDYALARQKAEEEKQVEEGEGGESEEDGDDSGNANRQASSECSEQ